MARNLALDASRGMTMVAILCFHSALRTHLEVNPDPSTDWLWRLLVLARHGVDVFFVLSGYLIGALIFAELESTGQFRAMRFLGRRGAKIWPAYFAAYLCTGLVVVALAPNITAASYFVESWPNLLFIQNYLYEFRWWGSWTLAVEEQFYTLLALLMFVVYRMGWYAKRYLVWVLLTAVLCIGLWRSFSLAGGTDSLLIYLQTHFRMDTLFGGVLLAMLEQYWGPALFKSRIRRRAPFLLTLCVVMLSFVWLFPIKQPVVGWLAEAISYHLVMLSAVMLVAVAAVAQVQPSRAMLSMQRIGLYTYTLYLAQYPARVLIRLLERSGYEQMLQHWWVHDLLFVGFTCVGSYLLSQLVEQPALRLRDRLLPRNQQTGGSRFHAVGALTVAEARPPETQFSAVARQSREQAQQNAHDREGELIA